MWVQRWLARAGLGVSGEGGQFEETVGGGPRMMPKGLAGAAFLEGSLDLRTAGSAAEPGTRGCREEARGRGGQADRLAKGRVGWQAKAPSGRTPRNVEAVGVWGPGSLGRGAPTFASRLGRVSPRGRRCLAPPGASRGRVAAHGAAPLRSPPLPSAPRVGNARRPLQAWCRWSALGSPRAAPLRGALVRPAKPAGAPTYPAAALRTTRVTRTASPGAGWQSAAPPCA